LVDEAVVNDRDRSYDYISTRRLEDLEARITPSWFVRTIRQIGSISISVLSIFGVGWSRREPVPETELRRQLSILSKVELDLRGHDEIGPIESEAPYVEQELMLGYSLWSFEDHSANTMRTAALWYGEVWEERSQVILIGNPQYLRGLPGPAISGIPFGTSSADPARETAFKTVFNYVEQLATRASVEDSVAEISPPDLEDPRFAVDYESLVARIGQKIDRAVEYGSLPETAFATRHFLARRVSFSRAGNTFFGIPVYVATVERSEPG
jgi:hypothetical protein